MDKSVAKLNLPFPLTATAQDSVTENANSCATQSGMLQQVHPTAYAMEEHPSHSNAMENYVIVHDIFD